MWMSHSAFDRRFVKTFFVLRLNHRKCSILRSLTKVKRFGGTILVYTFLEAGTMTMIQTTCGLLVPDYTIAGNQHEQECFARLGDYQAYLAGK